MAGFMLLIIAVINIVAAGFTGMYLWNWFVAPLGVIELTVVHALGLDVLVTFWTTRITRDDLKETTEKERFVKAGAVLGLSIGALVIGLILKSML